MYYTQRVQEILSYYSSDNPGTRANLARILMSGKLGGTGHMVILPVDQGFEHGPAKSFAPNPSGYDPEYHVRLAIDAGLNAYAAPLGMIELVASEYAGSIPMILKINSANSLSNKSVIPNQAITSSVHDALRLGCAAIGFTIYPGSDKAFEMMEEITELSKQAKSLGLAVVIWSYPRGGNFSKSGESALDVVAYSAHIAALLGAHIIKVKPPIEKIEMEELLNIYTKYNIHYASLEARVRHIMQSGFNGKRIVLFSGGVAKDEESVYSEIKSIKAGGAHGSIIGRNIFQRPRHQAIELLDNIIDIYLNNNLY